MTNKSTNPLIQNNFVLKKLEVGLAGVELMHMIRKGQLLLRGELCSAQRFYSLAE